MPSEFSYILIVSVPAESPPGLLLKNDDPVTEFWKACMYAAVSSPPPWKV